MHFTRLSLLSCVALVCLVCFAPMVCGQEENGKDGEEKTPGVTAYASSELSTSPARYAADASGAVTAWRTEHPLPQWVALDMGDRVKMNRLRWVKEPMPGGPRDYDVQLSNNDTQHDGKGMWRTVAQVRGNNDRCDGVVSFTGTRAQFVRLYVREQNPSLEEKAPHQFAIGDIQVGFVDPSMVPDRLTAEPLDHSIKLSWRIPPIDPKQIAGYNIYRSCSAGDSPRLLNLNGLCKDVQYIDDSVIPGATYTYRVAAVTAEGNWEGDRSREVSATAPKFEYSLAGKERSGLSKYAVGRFGLTDYLGHYSASEGLMDFALIIERNRQFYLMWPMLQIGDRGVHSLEGAGFPYSPNPVGFGTVRPTGIGAREAAKIRILSSSWTGMQLELKYKDARMVVYESLLSPAIAIKVEGRGVGLFDEMGAFGVGGPRYMAYLRGRSPEAGLLNTSRLVAPKMGIPWMLVWFSGGKGWANCDVPWMVTFQNRPDIVKWNGRFLDVSFKEECGFITLAPAYGVEKVKDTAEWGEHFPAAAGRQCSKLVPYFHAMPVECEESFTIDPETSRVKIKQQYKFLNIQDAWETVPIRFSPLPPIAALAMRSGYPVKTGYETRSLGYSTLFGPLYAAVDTDIIEWEIPAPLDIINSTRKPTKEDLRDAEIAKRILSLFPEERLYCPEGYAAVPAMDELRKRMLGRGDAAFRPYDGNYRMWGAMDDSLRTKFGAGVSMLLKEIGAFDMGALRLVAEPLSGKKAYVDSWAPDTFKEKPRHVRNAAEFLKGLWAYAFYFDKFDEIRKHWDSILPHFHLMRTASDWAMLSPLSALEPGTPRLGSSVNLDLEETLTVYDGLLAMARMAKAIGDMRTYEEAVYMSAKIQVLIYAYYNYRGYASTFTPWQAADGSKLDSGDGCVPSFSGAAGAGSWHPKPGKGYAVSPDVAAFYNTYLRSDIARKVYHSPFVAESARNDESAAPAQGAYALPAEDLLVRSLLFEGDPQKLWTWTRSLIADGCANDLSVYGSVAVRSGSFDPRPPDATWVKENVEATLAKEVAETPFETSIENAKKAESGQEIWKIGETDGKGEEFGRDIPAAVADKPYAAMFTVGTDKASSWPETQPAAMHPDKSPPCGWKVGYAIRFGVAPASGKCLLVIGLQGLPSGFPLYYQADVNGTPLGVHCRETPPGEAKPIQFAIEIDCKLFKAAGNTLVLSIAGPESIKYDSIRFVSVP